MVPYFGHDSFKVFIWSKPIRFGYKIWCLCGSDCFPYHFTRKSSVPLGSRVVNEKVDVIAEHSDSLKLELFFDNFLQVTIF